MYILSSQEGIFGLNLPQPLITSLEASYNLREDYESRNLIPSFLGWWGTDRYEMSYCDYSCRFSTLTTPYRYPLVDGIPMAVIQIALYRNLFLNLSMILSYYLHCPMKIDKLLPFYYSREGLLGSFSFIFHFSLLSSKTDCQIHSSGPCMSSAY